MGVIKAIETVYKGYRFRSRLEARWAVFFDASNWKWEYEKEGYDLGDVGYYLPDFWLPEEELFIEIKGQAATKEEIQKARELCVQSNHCVAVVSGLPERTPLTENLRVEAAFYFFKGVVEKEDSPKTHGLDNFPVEEKALNAARSARFEFGESGAPARKAAAIRRYYARKTRQR